MTILHACQMGDHMALWGELVDGPARRSTRSGRHPHSMYTRSIISALWPRADREGMYRYYGSGYIWLPSSGGEPLPSGSAAGRPRSGAGISLMQWYIDTLDIPWDNAMWILSEVARNRDAIAGMTVGPDLAYWSEVMSFAGYLVARQRFLPDLVAGKSSFAASWVPVFSGGDERRHAALARAMPAAARALSSSPNDKPSEPATSILKRAITVMINGMVRRAAWAAAPSRHMRRMRSTSIYDEWLDGLRTGSGYMDTSTDAANLETMVRKWRSDTAPADPPLRLCLRLEESRKTAGGHGPWFIRYLVQPHRDPEVTIPACRIWNGKAKIAGLDGTRARQLLLESLGRVSKIVSGMSDGLGAHGVRGHTVDVAGAYRFLSSEAPVLEQLGYGIMTPQWWSSGRTRTNISMRAEARTAARGGGMLDMRSIVRFDWKLALGNQRITLAQLQKLAMEKRPLVRVHGRWVDTGSGQLRRAADFVKRNKTMSVRDYIATGLGAGDASWGQEIDVSGRDVRIGGMIRLLRGSKTMEELPQPGGFAGTLRPYQARGYSWLSFLREAGLGGCLADDMGLGKTIQVLALIRRHISDGGRPALVVCPTSVMDNWKKEASRFVPGLSVMIHHGASRKSGGAFAREVKKHDVVITSYGLVRRDAGSVGLEPWGGVVLDEAQNIKNPDARQARAVRTLDAGFKFALTGTPVENSVGDLWSIMEFLNPGLLGTRAGFRRRFLVPIQKEHDTEAAGTLRRIVGPFMLRRLKTDRSVISDLPEKMEFSVYCSLTREQASLYAAVLSDLEERMRDAGGIRRKGLILAALTKLKQACNHPAHLLKDGSAIPDRSGKLARLTDMLGEIIESGEQALVFTQFVEMGEILQRHIRETSGREVLFLHGGVPRRQRDALVERFQEGGASVLVASLKAGGTGLNLTAASHVFHFDRWWNPAVENQATDRAFRIGQKRNVQVHKMICSGTLEERIDELMRHKQKISDEVVGTGEGWLTKLSDRDIREVLALSTEAVRI